MIGWIWTARTLPLLLQDISGTRLLHRWYYMALGAAAFLSLALGGYGHSFIVYTLPFSVVLGGLGLYFVKEAYIKSSPGRRSPLHMASYLLISIFFIRRLTYPLLGVNPDLNSIGILAEFISFAGLSGTGIAVYMEMFKSKREEEMERALKERSDKFLGQSKFSELGMMSAGIAHEINNPLAVIQARTTQLLRIYDIPERQNDVRDGLKQILNTSERINRTIQGIREFVHQDERGPVGEVSLKEIFDSILAFTGQRMKNHGISLRFYGIEDYSILCHKIQIEQVFLNLLNNSFDAIEYLPDKWIEVSCLEKDGKVQIYFKDSGKGIPPEIADRIMEPFFSTKDIGKGTGLGLALARGIVEKHGGTLVYVKNSPHTTFLVEIPKVQTMEWGMELQ